MTGYNNISNNRKFNKNSSEIHNGPTPGFKGINFKVTPKANQTEVYNAVFNTLSQGGCIRIFPKSGSYNYPKLLPLKSTIA